MFTVSLGAGSWLTTLPFWAGLFVGCGAKLPFRPAACRAEVAWAWVSLLRSGTVTRGTPDDT